MPQLYPCTRGRFRLHQKNLKPLPKQYILVANHPSSFEDIGIPALFEVPPLAKMDERKWFLPGEISEAAGTMIVKRDNKESRHAVVDQIIEKLGQGESVVIFKVITTRKNFHTRTE